MAAPVGVVNSPGLCAFRQRRADQQGRSRRRRNRQFPVIALYRPAAGRNRRAADPVNLQRLHRDAGPDDVYDGVDPRHLVEMHLLHRGAIRTAALGLGQASENRQSLLPHAGR